MREIDGKTRTLGLIGNPVEHSLSPFIHNYIAEKMNINTVYTTFKVEKGDVITAVKGAYALNILGMNVTVPHKSAVIEALSDIEPLAKAIGAVNTLVRTKEGYKGYNTDILGLKRELDDEGVLLKDEHIVILGAGGASRAIAFLCADEQAREIIILNRTLEKAQDIADNVNGYYGKNIARAAMLNSYDTVMTGDKYIAIQTSSVGLYPNNDQAVIEDEEFYAKLKCAVDIIYNPLETQFMKLAKAKGVVAYNGLKMLMYQGISAYELWNDIEVGEELIRELYSCLERQFNE